MQIAQKIGIGAFLCLSICMIMIAGTRLSKIQIGGEPTNSWQYFWLEIEACVAVCTVSLTAFRTILSTMKDMSLEEVGGGTHQLWPGIWNEGIVRHGISRLRSYRLCAR